MIEGESPLDAVHQPRYGLSESTLEGKYFISRRRIDLVVTEIGKRAWRDTLTLT
jgi:hypothetical protein